MDAILDTGLFDEEKAQRHPLWHKALYSPEEHVPESEQYGIESFVYRARRPFHPEKFNAFINATWPGLVRAKGHFWLATRPKWVGEFSIAGAIARVTAMGYWWIAVPKQHWPDHPDWKRHFERNWDEVWGDRRQELVFIGIGMDEAAIRAALDACLVGPQKPKRFDACRLSLAARSLPRLGERRCCVTRRPRRRRGARRAISCSRARSACFRASWSRGSPKRSTGRR